VLGEAIRQSKMKDGRGAQILALVLKVVAGMLWLCSALLLVGVLTGMIGVDMDSLPSNPSAGASSDGLIDPSVEGSSGDWFDGLFDDVLGDFSKAMNLLLFNGALVLAVLGVISGFFLFGLGAIIAILNDIRRNTR
jgi:hypothetical protein